jgi:hypothetical protein
MTHLLIGMSHDNIRNWMNEIVMTKVGWVDRWCWFDICDENNSKCGHEANILHVRQVALE